MKILLTAALAALISLSALAATTIPVQSLNPAGSTSGQTVVSTGASSAPMWGNVTATALAAQAANTVVANVTGSSASPTAVALPSCSTVNSALKYTLASGWSCGTTYALTTGTLAQFAATTSAQLAGVLSDETGTGSVVFSISPTLTGVPLAPTAAAGTNTTQIATTAFAQTAVTGGGNAGAFTTLNASGNDALFYQTTNALSIPNASATTVTTWTKVSDRLNTNFNASTGVFTAPSTGQYWVSAGLAFASGMTGGSTISASVRIIANGVTLAGSPVQVPATTTTAIGVVTTALANLSAGQTITIQAFQNSGAAVSLAVGSAFNNYISIQRVP